MQINSIFSSFLATEQIVLSNKEQVIAYAKEETKFEDETYKYKSSKSRHMDKNDLYSRINQQSRKWIHITNN